MNLLSHDAYFKRCMQHNVLSQDFLHCHMADSSWQHLSEAKYCSCQQELLVDRRHRRSIDVLLQVDFACSNPAATAPDFILLEHQSSTDKSMHIRMIDYIAKIKRRCLENNKAPGIPIVYPLVFYHGKSNNFYLPKDSWFMFSADDNNTFVAADEVYFQSFQLVNMHFWPDEDLLSRAGFSSVMQLAMKHIFDDDFTNAFSLIKTLLAGLWRDGERWYTRCTVEYILHAQGIDKNDLFAWVANNMGADQQEGVMTLAEQIRQEGVEQGIEQGIERGFEQHQHDTAARMLREGIEDKFIMRWVGLSKQNLNIIKQSNTSSLV